MRLGTGTSSSITGSSISISSEVVTAFTSGRNSDIDTSAEQLTTTSITASFGILVKAANANSGIIYVGPAGVTANSSDSTDGIELAAGESVLVKVDNANKVYCIASVNNQSAYYLVV